MKHSPDFNKLVQEAKSRIKEISVKKLNDALNKNEIVLIDVREPDEWFSGHIPQAIHIPRGILERDIENFIPDKKAHLVLYCGGGYRSALACDNLQEMGYSNLESLQGGIKAWIESQFPLNYP